MNYRIAGSIAMSLALTACAGPLTTPETGVHGCKIFLKEAALGSTDGSTNPLVDVMRKAKVGRRASGGRAPADELNMLILSGGGKYGAYGTGFLAGWTQAETNGNATDDILREKFDIVTGISTGAMFSSYTALGNLAPASSAERKDNDDAARQGYQRGDADILKSRGLVGSLKSNGLGDIRGRLDRLVDDMARRVMGKLAAMPEGRAVLVGLVNLTNGKFYMADLVEIAKADRPDCFREAILGSSAVPVQFPPRFIDDHPYVDGGVRFGAVLGGLVAEAARQSQDTAVSKVNVRVIVNGNLSANSPRRDPAGWPTGSSAARCDHATLETINADCGPVRKKDNRLLALAQRAAQDIMVDQLYRDSVYRIYNDLGRHGILGSARFTYISNDEIEAQHCRFGSNDAFDRTFMDCLSGIGFAKGSSADRWRAFENTPHVAGPGQ